MYINTCNPFELLLYLSLFPTTKKCYLNGPAAWKLILVCTVYWAEDLSPPSPPPPREQAPIGPESWQVGLTFIFTPIQRCPQQITGVFLLVRRRLILIGWDGRQMFFLALLLDDENISTSWLSVEFYSWNSFLLYYCRQAASRTGISHVHRLEEGVQA